ncbi:hypothetical protein LR48_Vigan04g084100 [Vigna angularis]|uniref:Uncharacterized protein n=1 Tax=Phaseolus angularis TaxID=3914 RepID=A0A0L9UD11_PHAAN|nr:hypothetical protein LR48_Vigan04g084100 [Vigna angularis]
MVVQTSMDEGRDVDGGVLRGNGGARKSFWVSQWWRCELGWCEGCLIYTNWEFENWEFFWVFLGLNREEEDDVVGGDLGCARLMMEGSCVEWRDSYGGDGLKWALQHDNVGDASRWQWHEVMTVVKSHLGSRSCRERRFGAKRVPWLMRQWRR